MRRLAALLFVVLAGLASPRRARRVHRRGLLGVRRSPDGRARRALEHAAARVRRRVRRGGGPRERGDADDALDRRLHGARRRGAAGRARALPDREADVPAAFLGTAPAPAPTQSTCWSVDLETSAREHMSLEPKVAEALAWAWKARAALQLSADEAQRITDTVTACAYSAAWRYPRRLTNQINWNAEMYASGDGVRPAGALRQRLPTPARRLRRRHHAPDGGREEPQPRRRLPVPLRPDHRDRASSNFDTPEYANIVIQALSYYDRALALGMPPLPADEVRRLRSWMRGCSPARGRTPAT